MAKPKFPKKTADVKEAVSNTNSPPSLTDTHVETTQAASAPVPETKTKATRRAARKPEIVRSEPRANLVPISLEDEIRSLAYLLSERRGFVPGHESEDWLAAEHEVRERYHQHTA